ncbi:MAG: hypothetical protein JO210_10970 [Acidobacteriaceae bacterium]|nr:hypothetical protein [Acidobacteriaceae bacterium]
MPTIPITDSLGLKVDIQFDEKSDAAKFGLKALESKTSEFVTAASKPLDETSFQSAVLGGSFETPTIDLGGNIQLTMKSGTNAALDVFREAKKTLFETDGTSPAIPISKDQAWIRFALDTSLATSIGVTSPSGFGVSGKGIEAREFSVYSLLEAEGGKWPTLKEGIEQALSKYRLLRTASDIRNQAPNTLYEWDVSGSFAIEASYRYPVATNCFSLKSAGRPSGHGPQIAPSINVSLTGVLSVSGEFRGRCYRATGSKVQLGLYKKKESDLKATFQATAGTGATVGSVDLVPLLFKTLPGADIDGAQIPEADQRAMRDSLQSAVDQGFCIALNASCSASKTDEAAVLYEIDLAGEPGEIDLAINAALKGDWTALTDVSAVKQLRNALVETQEFGGKATLNLLGIYDYASIQDFVRRCTILHNVEDGNITITDKETAQRISVSSESLAARDDKLRKVLDQAFLATVAYAATSAHTGYGVTVQATQSLLLYNERSSYVTLRKNLLLGRALQLLSDAELDDIALEKQFKYVRVQARAAFANDGALSLFFKDVPTCTPHKEDDLKQLGRRVLITLLDNHSAVDQARAKALQSDTIWAEMEAQKFPPGSPASYSDWFDIVSWAHSVATVAPLLKVVLEAAGNPKTPDPAEDPAFMAARDAVAKSIGEVTRNTKAAFEKGWPMAVMFALSGRKAAVSFGAQWDGKKHFEKQLAEVLTA